MARDYHSLWLNSAALARANGDLEGVRRQARRFGCEPVAECKRGTRDLELARFGELEARLHEAAAEADLAPRCLPVVQVCGAAQRGKRAVCASCQSFGVCEALQLVGNVERRGLERDGLRASFRLRGMIADLVQMGLDPRVRE